MKISEQQISELMLVLHDACVFGYYIPQTNRELKATLTRGERRTLLANIINQQNSTVEDRSEARDILLSLVDPEKKKTRKKDDGDGDRKSE